MYSKVILLFTVLFSVAVFAQAKYTKDFRIIKVTNLDKDGAGSFRAAVETEGPRLVVFEVGGIIDLDVSEINILNPYLIVAGQTAPSPGITIIKGAIYIRTHDVLIKHIRVRPGDANQPKGKGWEPDGITASGKDAFDVTVDHCSMSWAVDENGSASGPRTKGPDETSHNITFSNCIIAEGLNRATHKKGRHSKGILVHDFTKGISIIGNLFAHNARRNPYFKAFTTGAIVNNVIYNPETAAIQLDYVYEEFLETPYRPLNAQVSIVGNVLLHGINTRKDLALVEDRGDAYLEDNLAFKLDGQPAQITWGCINSLGEKPFWPAGLVALPASETIDYVANHAGARPKDRDETDKRIVNEMMTRTGKMIDSQNDVGGYPHEKMTERKLEIPKTGVNEWLEKLAKELE